MKWHPVSPTTLSENEKLTRQRGERSAPLDKTNPKKILIPAGQESDTTAASCSDHLCARICDAYIYGASAVIYRDGDSPGWRHT